MHGGHTAEESRYGGIDAGTKVHKVENCRPCRCLMRSRPAQLDMRPSRFRLRAERWEINVVVDRHVDPPSSRALPGRICSQEDLQVVEEKMGEGGMRGER